MAISDKLTYLNETKSQLKDMINYGLPTDEQITSSTTFRNYVKSIFKAFIESLNDSSTLFNNLPKKNGTGAVISLNDTANAPMRITLGATELTQAGTPTPSSPQDIHTISGSNKVVVCGKNLCKGITQNVFLNFTANVCGVAIGDSGLYIKVDGGTYKVSTTATQTRYRVGCVMNKPSSTSQTAYNGINNDNTNYTITIDTTGYNYLVVNATDLTKIQIEKGTTATTYEPYISQEAEVDLSSKNLFDIYSGRTGLDSYYTFNNDIVKITSSNTGAGAYWNKKINVSAGTYTFMVNVITSDARMLIKPLDSSGNIITNLSISGWTYNTYYNGYYKDFTTIGNNVSSFTLTSSVNQIQIGFVPKTANSEFTQILFGKDTITKFVPYYDYGEYCKIGNYEDKFIRTSGKNLLDVPISYSITGYKTINLTLSAGTYHITCGNITKGGSNDPVMVGFGNWFSLTNNTDITRTLTEETALTLYIYSNGYSAPASADVTSIINELMISKNGGNYEPYNSINEWYIKKNIGKVVLDGSETWNIWTANVYYIGNSLTTIRECLSNYYQFNTGQTAGGMSDGQFCIASSSNNYVIMFKNLSISTLADFKTWLTANNTNLYYINETLTYTQITGTLETQLENVYQKLLSYTGTTNISQVNNDLSFNLSVSAIEE